MKNNYRSDLSKAKHLGSSGSGASHWWYQRFTAILLIILTGWVFCFFKEINHAELGSIVEIFKKPHHIVLIILFVLSGIYHAILGIQVIIEDYIDYRVVRIILLLTTQIFSIITVIAFILAVLYVMIL